MNGNVQFWTHSPLATKPLHELIHYFYEYTFTNRGHAAVEAKQLSFESNKPEEQLSTQVLFSVNKEPHVFWHRDPLLTSPEEQADMQLVIPFVT